MLGFSLSVFPLLELGQEGVGYVKLFFFTNFICYFNDPKIVLIILLKHVEVSRDSSFKFCSVQLYLILVETSGRKHKLEVNELKIKGSSLLKEINSFSSNIKLFYLNKL